MSTVLRPLSRAQTYRNLLYLLIMFPLGIAYFVLLTVGTVLGLGLTVVLVGVPLLIGVILGSRYLSAFERELTNALLNLDIRPPEDAITDETTLWPQIRVRVVARSTWKGIVYLVLKLPLGILVFSLLIASLSVSAGLLLAPFIYTVPSTGIELGIWTIDTLTEAVIAVPIGMIGLITSMSLFNVTARLLGKIALILL
ncbi:sensor domain-containing protein [Halobellus limi]|uniref:Histidine kinase n=1 Tax=Halobellus limi TaxID=699433 RepID=A0A1H5ZZI4_9EURY|nr:sensor domain-containing protein [Halobellus limi]QCC47881.1 histidine kinase [Halobellus limi]SEG41601.1 Putative sensor [Halobellus limi]